MDELNKVMDILDQVLKDSSVPKNIKDTCRACVKRLSNEDEKLHIRIGAAISMLDELSQDPNLPFNTRAQIWEVASLLETAANTK